MFFNFGQFFRTFASINHLIILFIKNLRILPAMLIAMAWGVGAQAQVDDSNDSHTITVSIQSVAILDIETTATKNFNLGPTIPAEAGNPLDDSATNNTLWLNYSFIPSDQGETASITVQTDEVIPGMDINVEAAAAAAASGDGQKGTPTGVITLSSTSAQVIIQNIGASYTGDGNASGHQLTYTLDIDGTANYEDLYAQSNTVINVTYTIAED